MKSPPASTPHRRESNPPDLPDMELLLKEMSQLAHEAGDWRGHLPYEAAVAFHEDSRYRAQYKEHVDACTYCQQLVDTLHPSPSVLDNLLSVVHDGQFTPFVTHSAAEAAAEALAGLEPMRDFLRDVLSDWTTDLPPGTLKGWTRAQQLLGYVSSFEQDNHIGALTPWSETIAFSLDTHPQGTSVQPANDPRAQVIEEAASVLLACGFRVAHAGDPHPGGMFERIHMLADKFAPRACRNLPTIDTTQTLDVTLGVTGYCTWPIHSSITPDELRSQKGVLYSSDTVKWIAADGSIHQCPSFRDIGHNEPFQQDWKEGLHTLRETMVHETFARIAIGGTTNHLGEAMPSLACDTLASLRHRQPLYLLAGFGGCTKDIARALGLIETQSITDGESHYLQQFASYSGAQCLNNGLDSADNHALAATSDLEQAMGLVLKGLHRVSSQQKQNAQAQVLPSVPADGL